VRERERAPMRKEIREETSRKTVYSIQYVLLKLSNIILNGNERNENKK
jgi:hypothetical protein